MTGTRPTALVTAPFRGEGMETLQSLADVVYDPWIEQVPLRLYDGEKLAARIQAERRRHPRRRVRLRERSRVRLRPARHRLVPRRPQQRRHPGRDQGRHPRAQRAGPQRRRRRRDHDRAALRGQPPRRARRPRRARPARCTPGGKIPYQRYRAWQLAGRTAGIVGLGAVGRATQWRLQGLGMRVLAYDPYNPDATHTDLDEMLPECDVVSMHAVVTPETEGLMGAEQFARMKDGAIYVNSARARAPRHRRAHRRAAVGPPRRRGPRPLQGREPPDRPPAARS